MFINLFVYFVSYGWSGLFICEVKSNEYELKWENIKKFNDKFYVKIDLNS